MLPSRTDITIGFAHVAYNCAARLALRNTGLRAIEARNAAELDAMLPQIDVLSLSGSAHNEIAAQLGKPKFAVCAACHGADGKGNQALGAPNLTDKIWLHGWGEQAIINVVNMGKMNVMPPQGRLLTPEQVHVLAGYVLSLSRPQNAGGN